MKAGDGSDEGTRARGGSARGREAALFVALGVLVCGAATGLHTWLRRLDAVELEALTTRERHEALETRLKPKARELERTFRVMYESARTIALLPGVRNITGSNRTDEGLDVVATGRFSSDAALTVQQLYNNLAANVAVSEIYAVLDGFDPERGEVPFFMYDELILSGASGDDEAAHRRDEDTPEESEEDEYAFYVQQLAALEQRAPSFTFKSLDDVPAMSSPSMRTCDNTQYTSKRRGDERNAHGLLYSVPFYRPDGAFLGLISIVLRTNVLEAQLLDLPSLPLSATEHAELAKRGLSLSPAPARYVLTNARGMAIHDRRFGDAPGVLSQARASADPNLLATRLAVHDDAPWELALLFDPATVSAERAALLRWQGLRVRAVGAGTASLLLLLVTAFFMRRRAARRVKAFAALMAGYTTGDSALDHRIEPRQFSGELREVASHFNRFLETLARIVREVRVTSTQLAAFSAQVSEAARGVSEASAQQAARMQQATGSVTSMTEAIDSNAKETERAGALAAAASREAKESAAAVERLLASMAKIDDRLRTIEQIGRETNLLSLNAAVEAAHAGTVGEGFAIVAEEVRRLAERVRATASEIETSSADSAQLATQTGQRLERMVTGIAQTADIAQHLAGTATDQSKGAAALGQSITALSATAQQSAASLAQLSTTANELSSHAAQLDALMEFFKFEARP